MTTSHAMLAKIHIAKKELGIADDDYRELLILNYSVRSSKELSARQQEVLLDMFRSMGWKPRNGSAASSRRRDGRYIEIKDGPAAAQQRKVLAMWNALGYGLDKLHTRAKKQFNVERFEWLTDNRALHILITDLEQRQRSRKEHA